MRGELIICAKLKLHSRDLSNSNKKDDSKVYEQIRPSEGIRVDDICRIMVKIGIEYQECFSVCMLLLFIDASLVNLRSQIKLTVASKLLQCR